MKQGAADSKSSSGDWDVSGKWNIDCPYMREQWGEDFQQTKCELVISLETAEKGSRMWATFDFIALKGIFRFGRPGEVLEECPPEEWELEDNEDDKASEPDSDDSSPPPAQRKKLKVLFEEILSDEEGEDFGLCPWEKEDEDESLPKKAPTPHPPGVRPSNSSPKWDFEWHGSEAGESEMQIDFEHQHGHVVFSNGTLKGIFESGLTGRVEFTGKKLNKKTDRDAQELKEEWGEYSEENYEHARVGRWH